MPPLRMMLATLGTALVTACASQFRFDPGNPPRTTLEAERHRTRIYPLGNRKALTVMNSDPTGVMLEVTGPCKTDQDASEAVRVPEEIQQFVCGERHQFQLASPVRDFFQLQTTCQNGQFRQLLQGICQLSPETTE